jgi:hypothetical protein
MSTAHPAVEFVVAMFGPHKNGRVCVTSLPNVKTGAPDGAPIYTRSTQQITDFITKHDRPGFGCFVCVNPIKDKATRRAEETVTAIVCAHTDIDFAQVEETPEEIERIVMALPWAPSRVHHSGHGLHLFWFLDPALDGSPESKTAHKQLLKQIANLLAGDPAACLIPQLMRLPGTTNSKNGEQHEVRILSRPNFYFDHAILTATVGATPAPLLHRKGAGPKTGNGASPDNPFLAFATAHGETPLDVEQLLADMIYRGAGGGGNAHDTLLRCSAALLTRGEKREDVIERCLAALALAAARSGRSIDPAREQTTIAEMCDSWIAKISEREPEDEPEDKPKDEPPAADDAPAATKPADKTIPAEPTTAPIDLWNRLDPPPLPHGLLPSVIEDFAFEQGATMGADPAGLAAGALTICAAAIPDRIKLKVKQHSGWRESTRLWTGLVGDPSTKKSPIIYQVARPLQHIDAALYYAYTTAKAQWDALDRDAKRATPPPPQTRVKIDDTTVEAAQEILRDSPDGVLYLRDELSGFFGSMDKYTGARSSVGDRGFWLQAYNGDTYTYDRIKRGSGYIEHLSVSVLGGIQSEAMRKLAEDSVDDGLIQRINPIMLRRGGIGRDEPMSEATINYEALVDRNMQQSAYDVVLEGAAREVRQELERKHHELSELELINKKLGAHIGKYDGIFARLCLLWHCIDSPDGTVPSPEITEVCARKVAGFLSHFLLPHAIAFYSSIYGLSDDHDRLTAIAGYILAHKVERLTSRIVQRGDRSMRGLRRHEVENVCHQLSGLGWVTEAPRRRAIDPPRWDVNPEVHRLYQERAEQEATRRRQAREAIASIFTQSDEEGI